MPMVDTSGYLKNPLGATTAFANKKLDQGLDKIKSLGTDKARETLDKLGLPFDRIEKLEKYSSEARGYIEKARNYGLESVADFAGKASNVQTFMKRVGADNCDVANSVFGFANEAGKFLCDQLGVEVGNLNGLLGKIQSYAELASQGLESLEAIAKRMESFLGEIDNMIDNLGEKISQIGNDIISGIEGELNAYAEILQENAKAHLGNILGGLLSDPCIQGMTGNLITEAGKAVKKKAKTAL